MDEIGTAIVNPVVESLMVPVKRQLRYLISPTNYLRDLGTKMRQLEAKRLSFHDHMNQSYINDLVETVEVRYWLKEVEMIVVQAKTLIRFDVSCFNLKARYNLGRKAFRIIMNIDRLLEESSMIRWTDYNIDLKSRDQTFTEALEALKPSHKSRMIALCGVGGVGKTTMMEKLKKVVIERKMFHLIVKVVIGEKMDTIAIQGEVADYLGVTLTERTKETRAYKLRKSFEAHSNGGKNKILVILDDIWRFVDLNDIGLSPFANQGVYFKVLLTSRNRDACIMMGVEVNSILHVKVMEDLEAKNFFRQLVKNSDDAYIDLDLRRIEDDIVSMCHGLPIVIKMIASTFKSHRSKHIWEETLSSLKHKDVDQVVLRICKLSYNYLPDEETRSTLLLCALFPEDFDTPTEDLVRYSWGLKLFNNVYTIDEARRRLNTCIELLIHANLLIQSENVQCVKMHDLVRAFVLHECSKGGHASIVKNISQESAKHACDSCKRISLSCRGMSEFPIDDKYPNLLLLKLMHGDESLSFPENFCEEMKNLEVIAYDIMACALLPRSLQCSTNLRTLCLHRCSLMFDCSSIGAILSLEVLSFAYCSIQKLPSTIGKLKELKLLDLTGCVDLCIDDGVLKNLVKLEELYMRVADEKSIRFTDSNYDELAERLKNLFALEIEFFGNSQPNNMSFKKLERFKISLGCYSRENSGLNRHSSENTLSLVTNKSELLDSKMYELFEKTEVLHLQVDGVDDLGDVLADGINDDRDVLTDGINDLGDVLLESLHDRRPPFYNLRVLDICECANLRHIFTVEVANSLMKLERLTVSFCPVLETLIDGDDGGVGVIKFKALKFLSLGQLPKLTSLCNAANVIELPQLEELILSGLPNFTSIYPNNLSSTSSMSNDISTMQPFLNKKVVISQLKILKIFYMEKLKEIWLCVLSNGEEVGHSELRVIIVEGCDSLVNLFPINPMMSLLHNLEEVIVWNCGSDDVLFNIDVGYVGEIEAGSNNLRRIEVIGLGKLRDIWRVKGVNTSNILIHGFQDVEHIEIRRCKSFRNVMTLNGYYIRH